MKAVLDRQIGSRLTGKVIRYVAERGFGFIQADDPTYQHGIFFHVKSTGIWMDNGDDNPTWLPLPKEDGFLHQFVEFDLYDTQRGLQARQVTDEGCFQAAVGDIEERPVLRVVVRSGEFPPGRLYNPLAYTYRRIWEGKNLEKLRTLFPKNWYAQSEKFFFEANIDGEWVKVPDPR